MYMESKNVLSIGLEYPEVEDRFSQLAGELKQEVSPMLQAALVSISHVRAKVLRIAKCYPEFMVWAGDMRENSFVVTVWMNWMGDGDKEEKFISMALREGAVIS